MTKLRDDGILETGDPPVAGCFLGKEVRVCQYDDTDDWWNGLLLDIDLRGVLIKPEDEMIKSASSPWPILISAKTVDSAIREDERRFPAIVGFLEGPTLTVKGRSLTLWLRTHVKETADATA